MYLQQYCVTALSKQTVSAGFVAHAWQGWETESHRLLLLQVNQEEIMERIYLFATCQQHERWLREALLLYQWQHSWHWKGWRIGRGGVYESIPLFQLHTRSQHSHIIIPAHQNLPALSDQGWWVRARARVRKSNTYICKWGAGAGVKCNWTDFQMTAQVQPDED